MARASSLGQRPYTALYTSRKRTNQSVFSWLGAGDTSNLLGKASSILRQTAAPSSGVMFDPYFLSGSLMPSTYAELPPNCCGTSRPKIIGTASTPGACAGAGP